MTKTLKILFCFFIMIFAAAVVKGQNNTVGLIRYDSSASFNGYTLFSPLSSTNTYLIDNEQGKN